MKTVTVVATLSIIAVLAQPDAATDCSRQMETLERVVETLSGMTDITSLLAEVRRLDRKVSKMGKALKKIGLLEDENGEFVDPRTVTYTLSSSTLRTTKTTSTTTTATTTTTTRTTTSTSDLCREGWSLIGDGCYKIVTDQAISWEEARQQCLLQGTDLAEMNSIEEQRAVTEYLNNWHYGIPFWLAAQRNSRGKWRWEWTDTRVPSRAVRWGWADQYPRSIDLTTNSSCLAIRGRGDVGGLKVWENSNCEDQQPFICEYLWIQEYMEEEMSNKISRKLEENLMVVENIRRARQLSRSSQ